MKGSGPHLRTFLPGPISTYIRTLVKAMPWKVALALSLMVLTAFTEGIGLMLLVPLLNLVGLEVDEGYLGQISDYISSAFALLGVQPDLPQVLIIYIGIVSIRTLLSRWQTVTSIKIQYSFAAHLRQRLYAAIAKASWLHLSRGKNSDFVHLLTVEIDRVGMGTYHLLYLVVSLVVTSVYIGLAFKISAETTSLVFLCSTALTLLLRGKMIEARSDGKDVSSTTNRLYASALEHVEGMKTIKSYGAEERTIEIFTRQGERVSQKYIRAITNYADVRSIFEICSVSVLSLILYLSVEFLKIPTAGLFVLLFLFVRIVPRFSSIQQSYLQFVGLLPSFVSLMETKARLDAAAEATADRRCEIGLGMGIRFEEVSFCYGDGRSPAVDRLSLELPAGKTAAIVGSSGAGKSTVADLLMGLVVPDRGRVLVNGCPLSSETINSWRSRIGYVAQETFLFNDTVRANLLWAEPEAEDPEIEEALKLAAAEEFVSELPLKMETIIGDRGMRLSGGEKQRIALARALLRRPALLIMDEATSHLDSENERRIMRAIEELHGSLTILIITHRIATIRGSDVIHVLEKGRLVESGSWRELMETNGRLAGVWRSQEMDDPSKGGPPDDPPHS